MSRLLIRETELGEGRVCDVRIRDDRIVEIAKQLTPETGEPRLEACGGALLPGLHDHHIHLMALGASLESLRCGPPDVQSESTLAELLRQADIGVPPHATPARWLRGYGYHESIAGELDRWKLDGWIGQRPARIQHRSGALWMLNSAAIRLLGLDRRGETLPDGVERDPLGRASGRIYRQDDWLRDRIGEDTSPDLARVGARLARHGVTAMGDATPTNGPDELDRLSRAIASGALPQRLLVMGTHALPVAVHPRVMRGHVKLVLDERELPELDALIASIERAHASARGVAIHCVTRAELVMAAVALAAAGCTDGDRIEHASVAPPELVALLASLPVAIVTQPNFIFERGDAYLQDVEPGDRPWLYRCRGFIDAGIALAAGTDAPFGEADPWATMRAAVDRRSAAGVSLGRDEALDPDEALALFTAPLQSPGQYTPAPGVGRTADLCLLDRPWSKARDTLDSDAVTATILDGSVIWRAT